MAEDKNTGGAPSSDTTSALFVSARKKQLQQQEEERRAKEKEEQRLAAEAEVRRLEFEVEERRRKAEADARRVAEEARAMQAHAALHPNAVLGTAPSPAMTMPKIPKSEPPKEPQAFTPQTPIPEEPAQSAAPAAGLFANKKLLAIIGGGVAVIALAVILVVVLGGSGAKLDPNMALDATYSNYDLTFNYPAAWETAAEQDPLIVTVTSDYKNNDKGDTVYFTDVTEAFDSYYYDMDYDAVTSGSMLLDMTIKALTNDGAYDEFDPSISESGGFVSGGPHVPYTASGGKKGHLYLNFVPCGDRLLLTAIDIPERNGLDDSLALCKRIAKSGALEGGSVPSGNENPSGGETPVPDGPDEPIGGANRYYDETSGISFEYPDGFIVGETTGANTVYAPIGVKDSADSSDLCLVYNYTPEFNAFVDAGNSGMDNLIYAFAVQYISDAGYDFSGIYNESYSNPVVNLAGNEVIALFCENDEYYFCFYLAKVLTDPQQVAAFVIESKSIEARSLYQPIIDSLDLE